MYIWPQVGLNMVEDGWRKAWICHPACEELDGHKSLDPHTKRMGQRNPINHQEWMVETCWNPRNHGIIMGCLPPFSTGAGFLWISQPSTVFLMVFFQQLLWFLRKPPPRSTNLVLVKLVWVVLLPQLICCNMWAENGPRYNLQRFHGKCWLSLIFPIKFP